MAVHIVPRTELARMLAARGSWIGSGVYNSGKMPSLIQLVVATCQQYS